MKANHNEQLKMLCSLVVVVNISNSKNESNHNRACMFNFCYNVVVNISNSKNESKSQHGQSIVGIPYCCGKYQ